MTDNTALKAAQVLQTTTQLCEKLLDKLTHLEQRVQHLDEQKPPHVETPDTVEDQVADTPIETPTAQVTTPNKVEDQVSQTQIETPTAQTETPHCEAAQTHIETPTEQAETPHGWVEQAPQTLIETPTEQAEIPHYWVNQVPYSSIETPISDTEIPYYAEDQSPHTERETLTETPHYEANQTPHHPIETPHDETDQTSHRNIETTCATATVSPPPAYDTAMAEQPPHDAPSESRHDSSNTTNFQQSPDITSLKRIDLDDLHYPEAVDPATRYALRGLLSKAAGNAQNILDLLELRLKSTHNPIKDIVLYCGSLVRQANANKLDLHSLKAHRSRQKIVDNPQAKQQQTLQQEYREAITEYQHFKEMNERQARAYECTEEEYLEQSGMAASWDVIVKRLEKVKEAINQASFE